ncbi:MAG: hypothetical protein ACOVOT_06235 [Rubrivivax sp.]
MTGRARAGPLQQDAARFVADTEASKDATLHPFVDTARHGGHPTMLDRIKELGGQLTTSAAKVAGSMKEGADTVAAQAGDALHATRRKAAALGERAGTAATREAVCQMRDMLALAAEELRARPVIDGPVTLTAKVDLMLTSLQMEFVLHPDTRVLHVPRSAAPEPGEVAPLAVELTVQPAGPAAGPASTNTAP